MFIANMLMYLLHGDSYNKSYYTHNKYQKVYTKENMANTHLLFK